MARPIKHGLSYFPLDVSFFDDAKIRTLLRGSGPYAVVSYLYILSLVYKDGYYIKMSKDELVDELMTLLNMGNVRVRRRKVELVVHDMLALRLIDRECLETYNLITSVGIQKQYLLSKSRSKAEIQEFDLLSRKEKDDVSSFLARLENDEERVNVAITPVNDAISTQNKNKNKNKKENKKSDKEDICDKGKSPLEIVPNFEKLTYYTKYLIMHEGISPYDADIPFIDSFFVELEMEESYEDLIDVVRYVNDQMISRKNEIGRSIAYLKEAVMDGLYKKHNPPISWLEEER